MLNVLFLLTVLTAFVGRTLGYDLVREHAGPSFFDGWEYYSLYDNLTLGDVNWVDQATAVRGGLTYVSGHNTSIIRVDNYSTVAFNDKRNSVRITSKDFYSVGSLWVFDAVHLPFGCSVWPAWWTKGVDWPNGGELDIVENINLADHNQMAVHTTPGCNHTAAPGQTGASGQNADCSPGSGCVVSQTDPRSWGKGFAEAGGGVWATQFDVQGIFIWFWTRADVPSSLSPSAPVTPLNISAWGPPTASWLATTCDIPKFFTAQQLIIDITLCGVWAGVPPIYNSTCGQQAPNDPTNPVSSQNPRTPSCYADNVVGPGARFDDAYFEINHIRAYTTAPPSPSSTSPSASTNPGSAIPNTVGDRPVSSAVPTRSLCAVWLVLGAFLGASALLM